MESKFFGTAGLIIDRAKISCSRPSPASQRREIRAMTHRPVPSYAQQATRSFVANSMNGRLRNCIGCLTLIIGSHRRTINILPSLN